MTPMPPPCRHCGRARLSTGICPHCEHVYCVFCRWYMRLGDYADHAWGHRHLYGKYTHGVGYLFWWEITKEWPERCPECDAILTPEGLCPEAVGLFKKGETVRVEDMSLLGIGPRPPARRF